MLPPSSESIDETLYVTLLADLQKMAVYLAEALAAATAPKDAVNHGPTAKDARNNTKEKTAAPNWSQLRADAEALLAELRRVTKQWSLSAMDRLALALLDEWKNSQMTTAVRK